MSFRILVLHMDIALPSLMEVCRVPITLWAYRSVMGERILCVTRTYISRTIVLRVCVSAYPAKNTTV
jgi:hypothetical protein